MGARVYWWFKALVFALLAWNTAVFVHAGTWSEGVDSVAWLVLLALFELETGGRPGLQRGAAVIRGVRLAAACAIPVAAAGYVLDREWLDAINSILWIAVVALLETQLRLPAAATRYRPWLIAAAVGLYGGLASIALAWLWQADWFSAYDAALWLLAFATIEINVIQIVRRWPAAARSTASRTQWNSS
jgi:hypothetical protein